MNPAPSAPDGGLVAAGLGWAMPPSNPILSAAQAGAAFVTAGSVVAAEAAVFFAKDHMSKVDVQAGIAGAVHKSQEVMAVVGPAAGKAREWAAQNPSWAACAAVAAVGLGVAAAPGLVSAPLLGAAGFGSGGVAGGSAAAAVQAGIGNVAAGSAFAFLQSAGAGGAALGTVNGVIQGAGLAAAGAAAAKAASSSNEGCRENVKNGEDDGHESGVKPSEEMKVKL